MRFHAAAFDYDGTLATDAKVSEQTLEALHRLRASGRRLLLVTGRKLDELVRVFSYTSLFERIVAENGGVLCCPQSKECRVLSEAPPQSFIDALRQAGVKRLSVGKVILATWEPWEETVLQVIHRLGIEYHIIFNKGAVMILPSTVNKATGLKAALEELQIPAENVAGIGDAENDHAFLDLCGFSAAVANAVPALKQHVHLVTQSENGKGVVEMVERVLEEGA